MAVRIYAVSPSGQFRSLGLYGSVGQVKFSWTCPGGPTQLTANLYAPRDVTPPCFTLGSRIVAYDGGSMCWAGTLDIPKRPAFGQPWVISAIGISAESKRFVIGDNNNTVQGQFDFVVGQGLNWTRNGVSIPSLLGTANSANRNLVTFDEYLARYAQIAKLWMVFPLPSTSQWGHVGRFVVFDPPTDPTFRVDARGTPGGRSMDNFANDVYVSYTNTSAVAASLSVANAESLAALGSYRVGVNLDSTTPITSTQATTIAQNLVDQLSAAPAWTDAVACTRHQVRTLSGGVVTPAQFRPGVVVKLAGVDPDTAGIAGQYAPTFLVGETAYDGDTDTVTITPAQTSPQTLLAALTKGRA